MSYVNLPGVPVEKQDGGLAVLEASGAPITIVLGTASSGPAETPWVVSGTRDAAVLFGSGGTLTRGMYEVKQTNPQANIVLMRIGATPAILEGIGVDAAVGGVTIRTNVQDDTAEDQYSFYWDNTTSNQRLVIKNVDADVIVFDRDYSDPTPTTDLGEVSVSGSPTNGAGDDIGDEYTFFTLAEAAASTSPDFDLTLTSGTDGTSLSRMKLYECLFKAYKLLENSIFAFVNPMDVYIDDKNAADGDTFAASPGVTYPVAQTDDDILLYFYAEEYEGEWMFWWREAQSTGNPDVYPTGYATTSPSGVALGSTAFNEVNFAYQLADFCWTISADSNDCHGFVGVKPPTSTGIKDVATWVGKSPTYTIGLDGTTTIAGAGHNGTGLMGIKFMAGQYGFRGNVAFGGFIGTEEHFLDGTELSDRGGELIDIGQYISVCGQWATVYNTFDTSGLGYITTIAPSYSGFVSTLDPKSAPTNKVIPGVTLPFRISNSKVDTLAGMRYIMCQSKSKGVVIADAPTAALPTSDYRRLTTVRIVKLVIDALRNAADPFLGEGMQKAALETALENELAKLTKAGYLLRYNKSLTQTPAQRVAGHATLELELVPVLELRQLTIVVALSPV